MSYSTTHAFFANAVYDTGIYEYGDPITSPDGTNWTVIAVSEPNSFGFEAAAYKNAAGEVILATRGTESSLLDILSDMNMGLAGVPAQFYLADAFLAQVKDIPNIGSDITIVGHSLGGAIASWLGFNNSEYETVTFNAYGIGNILSYNQLTSTATDSSNITNHVNDFDIVSHVVLSDMIGNTYTYPLADSVKEQFGLVGFTDYAQIIEVYGVVDAVSRVSGLMSEAHRMGHFIDNNYALSLGGANITESLISAYDIDTPYADSSLLAKAVNKLISYGEAEISANAIAFLEMVLSFDVPAIGAEVNEFFLQSIGALFYDPLVLDMDGDGFETVGVNTSNPLMFDITASGVKQSVGWVAPDDGFLVFDQDSNGIIDSGAELFGDATPKSDGTLAQNGFEALADLDSNGDGVISSLDTSFSKLKVWRDANQDGISQSSELVSLSTAGVASLNLAGVDNLSTFGNGNQLGMVGTYVKSDGTVASLGAVHSMGDVNLTSNPFVSQFTDSIPVLESLEGVPNLQGSGLVRNLREAASLQTPEGEALRVAIAALMAETTRAGQISKLDAVVSAWANTSTMATSVSGAFEGSTFNLSFAGVTDGTPAYQAWSEKLSILEKFNGMTLVPVPEVGSFVTLDIIPASQDSLNFAYGSLKDSVYSSFAFESRLRPYLDSVEVIAAQDGLSFDFSAMEALLTSAYASSPATAIQDRMDLLKYAPEFKQAGWDGWQGLNAWTAELQAAGQWDGIWATLDTSFVQAASTGNDIHFMSSTSNRFNGGVGDDIIVGAATASSLTGGAGEDVLVSGTGYDELLGGADGDNYIFNLGFGQDVIIENGVGQDVIEFGMGITPADISLSASKNGRDLILAHANGVDSITITNHFNYSAGTTNAKIESVKFADGTVWDAAKLALGAVITGTVINDIIVDQSGSDMTIIGGAGNDALSDTGGNTSYVFQLGDGSDTIHDYGGQDSIIFGAGIVSSDISLSASMDGRDLILKHSNGSDQITLIDYFYSLNTPYKIESVKFADGTIWDATILATGASITGSAGNDTLNAAAGVATTIQGGGGNDVIYGSGSNDTYLFSRGDGSDTITDSGAGVDRIKFGEGIAPGDVSLTTALNGRDLVLKIAGTADQITIVKYFYSGSYDYKIESIEFADGTVWNAQQLATAVQFINGTDAADTIVSPAVAGAIISGGKGNDTITGSSLANVYIFNLGDGADVIYDYGAGGDVIQFGEGILPGDILMSTSLNGYDLVLSHANGMDKITLRDFFRSSSSSTNNYKVDLVQFADGTIWDSAKLATGAVVTGTSGNDVIYAAIDGAPTTITGGTGNDTIYGDSGSDTYIFNLGDGADSIKDYGPGVDTLKFGPGILPSDITLSTSFDGRSLTLTHANGMDKITLVDFFYDGSAYDYKIESVQFADGTVWDSAKLATGAVITGTAGNDTINAANDATATAITGGQGNDTIYGSFGGDTYYFNLGDGIDTIKDYGTGVDAIKMGEGILPGDISMSTSLNGRDLVLTHSNGTDKITLVDFFYSSGYGYKIESIQFADGTVWDAVKLASGAVITGTAGNDTISAAHDGTATTITGGAGNDTIYGSTAGDAYYFTLGDGADTIRDYGTGIDTIKLGAGILPSDITMSTSLNGRDLVLGHANGTDKITLKDFFYSSGYGYKLESVQFADGTVWDAAKLATGAVITGTAGNDTITGAYDGAATTITGGQGNDTIYGTKAGDTFIYNLGDGADIITEPSSGQGVDTIKFGAGIKAADLAVSFVGSDLIITLPSGTDKITVKNYFASGLSGGNPMIDSFQFADGTSVTSADMTAAAKGKNGTTANDVLTGSALNDKIYGLGGNDTLTGGAGNDLLVGGVGSDTYVLGRGTGQDVIDNTTADSTVGKQDAVQYAADVASDQLWFQHVGADLIVSVIGTTDKVSIQNWYGSSANHVQHFVAGDGKVLSESQVEQLVSAMAGFAPPPQGQTTLPQNYQEQLAPTLAANWQ